MSFGELVVSVLSWVRERGFIEQSDAVQRWFKEVDVFVRGASREEAELISRDVMEKFADIIRGLLLMVDASHGDELTGLVVEEWFAWNLDTDIKIVFGAGVGPSKVRLITFLWQLNYFHY